MRIRDDRAREEPEINLVPLIDVILVLIIFFVVTTTFDARSALQLQLPQASERDVPPPQYGRSVLVNADGRYFVNDRELVATDAESLRRVLSDAAGPGRDKPVLLRADARTPYQAVVTAQDVLAQLGFQRIAIATATAPAKEARK